MENTKLEKTGQILTSNEFKTIINKIDDMAPKIEVIDWGIFDAILHEHDFTKCKSTLDTMKKFYEYLWTHVVFPHEEEAHLKNRENGRLIVESFEYRKKAELFEAEANALREELQGLCSQEAQSL